MAGNRPPTYKERDDKYHQDLQKERDEAARKRKAESRERENESNARKKRHNEEMDKIKENGGCFPKGTKISTPFGLCDISALQKGDFVSSINCKTGESQSSKILKKLTHTGGEIWLINFSDGSSIRTTSVHSFLINGKWKKASEIKAEDAIASYGTDVVFVGKTVTASYITDKTDVVYNIIVEDDFNFIADGVLAHSFTYFRGVRMVAWRLYQLLHSTIGIPEIASGLTKLPR